MAAPTKPVSARDNTEVDPIVPASDKERVDPIVDQCAFAMRTNTVSHTFTRHISRLTVSKLVLVVAENDFGNSVIGDPVQKASRQGCYVMRLGATGRAAGGWRRGFAGVFKVSLGNDVDVAAFEAKLKKGEYTVAVLEVSPIWSDDYGYLPEVRSQIKGTCNEIGALIHRIVVESFAFSDEDVQRRLDAQRERKDQAPPLPRVAVDGDAAPRAADAEPSVPARPRQGPPKRKRLTAGRYAISDGEDDSELPVVAPTAKRRKAPAPSGTATKSRPAHVNASPPPAAPVQVNRMTALSGARPVARSRESPGHQGFPERGSSFSSDDDAPPSGQGNRGSPPRTPRNPPKSPAPLKPTSRRSRPGAKRSTGGKAPRSQLSHLGLLPAPGLNASAASRALPNAPSPLLAPPKQTARPVKHHDVSGALARIQKSASAPGTVDDNLAFKPKLLATSSAREDVEDDGDVMDQKKPISRPSQMDCIETLKTAINRRLQSAGETFCSEQLGYISQSLRFDGVDAKKVLERNFGGFFPASTARGFLKAAKDLLAEAAREGAD